MLVLPGAHDALSARLIEMAGFKAYFIGGFTIAGVHYAVPAWALSGWVRLHRPSETSSMRLHFR